MRAGVLLRFESSRPVLPGSAVRFVCPFCRRSCSAGVSAYGEVIAQHAAPHCPERARSSSIEFMRAVRSKLGGDS